MSKHTVIELATDWNLFCEYADTDATWTEDEFNSTPVDEKIRILTEAFGEEEAENGDS